MSLKVQNLKEKFDSFSEHWTPKVVGELNDQSVKIAKFKGDFVRHHHAHEDELFLVIEGTIFIELDNETLRISAGELVVIPRGVPHKPYAPEEAKVLLFEPKTTLKTGNEENERTQRNLERL